MSCTSRFELFLLGEGEKKVSWKWDTRVQDTAIFTFNKEDHTLGNLLSKRLHKYPEVIYSAYKLAHPLIAQFELRVTTDGSFSPKQVVVKCCHDLVQDLDRFSREFTKEWELKKIANNAERK
ncbi:RNA polymerase Rpb3/Rpb11 dimerization domain-containing protein [Lineolata rhizophorae]|uniref:RNA polymerase Rpb3/Rpb11 dimerization domain-containing protein n=1 Tax=Lineolata rhizophorae TaxID=578093 RepID=A0A6A6NYW0_9PEZI|nr:RNA polymerase Rpb3/Rpb11 dimerization domain-containing protein [Lineolata rhizophorae]